MSSDVSLSVARGYDPAAPRADLSTFLTLHTDFYALQSLIVKPQVWSPIVWAGGKRNKESFSSSQLIALDFDSGEWSLGDAIEYVQQLAVAAVVATTKSHRREKVSGAKRSPPCDRYRMVLLADVCTSRDDFEYTMRSYAQSVPCDAACVDGARYYFPCNEVAWYQDGAAASWLACPFEETAEAKALAYSAPCDPADYRNLWSLPFNVAVYIMHGALHERHKKAYIVGCELARRGFGPDEILELFRQKRSPLLHIGEGKDHVGRCIENACKRVGVAAPPDGWTCPPGGTPLPASAGRAAAPNFTVIGGGKQR